MRRFRLWLCGLILFVGGCAETPPDRADDYAADGVFLFQQNQYVHARQCFQEASRLHPGDFNLTYDIGRCYEKEGQVDKAQAAYEECLRLAPNHADCHHALAALLYFNGNKDKAKILVEQWLRDEPRNPAAFIDDAWLYRQNGDLHSALSRAQDAYKLDSKDNRVLTEMALVYEALNRPDHAKQLLEQALEVHPDQPDVKAHLAVLEKARAQKPAPQE